VAETALANAEAEKSEVVMNKVPVERWDTAAPFDAVRVDPLMFIVPVKEFDAA
jgi:hypothetical protein